MGRLQKDHLAAINAVLAAIPADMPVAHAILVLEDANVACQMGLCGGLTIEAIRRSVVEIEEEIHGGATVN